VRPAVLVGGGAEVVPQADDLARAARRREGQAGERQLFSSGLRIAEQVALEDLHGVALDPAQHNALAGP